MKVINDLIKSKPKLYLSVISKLLMILNNTFANSIINAIIIREILQKWSDT
jgi:hypothetical protein